MTRNKTQTPASTPKPAIPTTSDEAMSPPNPHPNLSNQNDESTRRNNVRPPKKAKGPNGEQTPTPTNSPALNQNQASLEKPSDEDIVMTNVEGKNPLKRGRSESLPENSTTPEGTPPQPESNLTSNHAPTNPNGDVQNTTPTGTTDAGTPTNDPAPIAPNSPNGTPPNSPNGTPPTQNTTPTNNPDAPSGSGNPSGNTPSSDDDLYNDEPTFDEEAAAEYNAIVAELTAKQEALAKLRKRIPKKAKAEPAAAPTPPPPAMANLPPAREYTPIPVGGFPPRHGNDPLWTTDNVATQQAQDWLGFDGAKALVMIEKETSHEPERCSLLAAALAKDINTNFHITGAKAIYGFSGVPASLRRDEPPYTFCVFNLPNHVADALVNTGAWRSKSIRYYCYPLGRIEQTYVGSLTGLCNVDSPTDLLLIKSYIQTAWKKGSVAPLLDEILQPISRDRNGDLKFGGKEGLIDNVINSLTISCLETKATGATDAPSYRMYLQTGITSTTEWLRLKAAIETTKYPMSFYGQGVYFAKWYCGICRGIDHPQGMCPFLSIPQDIPITEPAVPRIPKIKKKEENAKKKGNNPQGSSKQKGPKRERSSSR